MSIIINDCGLHLKDFKARIIGWLCNSFGVLEEHYANVSTHGNHKRADMSTRFLEMRASIMEVDDIWCGDSNCTACIPQLAETLTEQFLQEMCGVWENTEQNDEV